MWRGDRDAALGLAASLVAAVVAVTCHRGARLDVPAAQAGTERKTVPSARAPERASAAPRVLASSLPAVKPPDPLGLGHLRAAFAGLEAKKRSESVHIVWFGDSHTAALYAQKCCQRSLPTGDGFRAAASMRGFDFGSGRLPQTAVQKADRTEMAKVLRCILADFELVGRPAEGCAPRSGQPATDKLEQVVFEVMHELQKRGIV